jgi:hypothetical protein
MTQSPRRNRLPPEEAEGSFRPQPRVGLGGVLLPTSLSWALTLVALLWIAARLALLVSTTLVATLALTLPWNSRGIRSLFLTLLPLLLGFLQLFFLVAVLVLHALQLAGNLFGLVPGLLQFGAELTFDRAELTAQGLSVLETFLISATTGQA